MLLRRGGFLHTLMPDHERPPRTRIQLHTPQACWDLLKAGPGLCPSPVEQHHAILRPTWQCPTFTLVCKSSPHYCETAPAAGAPPGRWLGRGSRPGSVGVGCPAHAAAANRLPGTGSRRRCRHGVRRRTPLTPAGQQALPQSGPTPGPSRAPQPCAAGKPAIRQRRRSAWRQPSAGVRRCCSEAALLLPLRALLAHVGAGGPGQQQRGAGTRLAGSPNRR